ncbi:MAG TPA: hypothetical protein VHW74_06385 [Mycobacteriales bacterium]|nr:hypothetical protein [Mycobacteriales bacterium]
MALSYAAWLLPGHNTVARGFPSRAAVNVGGVMLVVIWYATCLGVVLVGRRIGRIAAQRRHPDKPPEDVPFAVADRVYYLLTVIAAIGVLYSLEHTGGLSGLVRVFQQHQANSIRASLATSFGIQTLRYASPIAAAVAVDRLLQRRRADWFFPINIGLLGLSAAFGTRLSIVLFAIVLLFLLSKSRPDWRIRLRTVVGFGIAMFVAITPVAYSRNADYYRAEAGVTNPFAVSADQVVAYLDTPSQVSLGVASGMVDGRVGKLGSPSDAVSAVRPTFLQTNKTGANAPTDPGTYNYTVDVLPNYTTNSVFGDTAARYGFAGLLAVLIAYFLAAMLFGRLERGGGLGVLASGVILYVFSEAWRLFVLNQGFVIFILLLLLALAAVPEVRVARDRRPDRTRRWVGSARA